MTNLDTTLQATEADILQAFEKFGPQFNTFSDLAHRIIFSAENSEEVKTFFKGLDCMQAALAALIEATKVVAEIKGVEFTS